MTVLLVDDQQSILDGLLSGVQIGRASCRERV